MSEYYWQKISMPCPKCATDHIYESEIWVHGDTCQGLMMINNKGLVRCSKCGKTANIAEMHFSCNSKLHNNFSPSKKELAAALAIDTGISNGSLRWFKSLLDNL